MDKASTWCTRRKDDVRGTDTDEKYYPASIEAWEKQVQQSGNRLRINFLSDDTSYVIPLSSIRNLCKLTDPLSGRRLNDTSFWKWRQNNQWKFYGNPKILIEGYPKGMHGCMEAFPTYYHCRQEADGTILIAYWLWYPYDHKGYRIPFLDTGDHRGDIEGIHIVLKKMPDVGNVTASQGYRIQCVFYSGHGIKKYVDAADPKSGHRLTEVTHTQVFISWGSHTCYPEPGFFRNYKAPGPNIYDDLFCGGYAVQAWDDSHSLINVGETHTPMNNCGWLNFVGKWGPDNTSQNSSTVSPPGKSFWNYSDDKRMTWQEAKEKYELYWERPFEGYKLE